MLFGDNIPKRTFKTYNQALIVFRNKVREQILNGTYTCKDDVVVEVGANPQNYHIKWKKNVLYPVYDEIIGTELKLNPHISHVALMKKYPFAQSFLKNQGGLKEYRRKRGVLYRTHGNRQDLLNNCVEAVKILLDEGKNFSRKNIQSIVGAHLSSWDINMNDIFAKSKKEVLSRIRLDTLELINSAGTIPNERMEEYLFDGYSELFELHRRPDILFRSFLQLFCKENLLSHDENQGFSLGYFGEIFNYLNKKMIPVNPYKKSEVCSFIKTSTEEVEIPKDLIKKGWQSRFFTSLRKMGLIKELKLDHDSFYNLAKFNNKK